MSRSNSGRIVIEIDPKKKQKLHAMLALQGITMKSWFLNHVDEYMGNGDKLVAGLELAIDESVGETSPTGTETT